MEHTKEVQIWLTNPEEYVWGRKPSFWFDFYETDMMSQGWLKVTSKEVTIEFDMPSEESVRGTSVEALREAIRKIDAEAQKKKNHLEGRIQNLLAIGHEPRAAEDGFDLNKVVGPDDGTGPF